MKSFLHPACWCAPAIFSLASSASSLASSLASSASAQILLPNPGFDADISGYEQADGFEIAGFSWSGDDSDGGDG